LGLVRLDVDLAIVGGGIAAAAVAWAMAPDAGVAVLEAKSGFGYHSTGRSAGCCGWLSLDRRSGSRLVADA